MFIINGYYIKSKPLQSLDALLKDAIVYCCVLFVLVITTAQLHSTRPELRFCAGSNPACGVSAVEHLRWWESLTMVSAGNKAKHLSSVNHTTKTIHYHHHCRWNWNGNAGTNTLNSVLHRKCRKTSFICCFIVTGKNFIWPVVFIFFCSWWPAEE